MSLIEILVSVLILLLLVLTLTEAFISCMRFNVKIRDITEATNFSQMILEQLRYSASDQNGFDGLHNINYTLIDENPVFIYKTDVITVKSGLVRVAVSVYYKDPKVIQPDNSRPKGGKIVQLSCYLIRP